MFKTFKTTQIVKTIADLEEYRKARQMLFDINAELKNRMPKSIGSIDFTRAGYTEVKEGSIDGRAIERVIIILRGFGCGWARQENGGCTMCGHLSGSSRGGFIPVEHLEKQFDDALAAYDFRKYPMLCLYNGGSFLNEAEIPAQLRRYIFKKVNAMPYIRRFVIESRPQYITEAILDEIDTLLPHTVVEVGIGLESANDIVRELILNKGVPIEEYISTAKKFQKRNIRLTVYVLVKPPFLTEAEAIEDAVSTIRFAHQMGANIVFLEPVSIQDYTFINYLWEAGFYNPPRIWSIFEIIKQTFHLGLTMRIGGFDFFPQPKMFTSNCPACNPGMIGKIKEFNRKGDIKVFQDLHCPNHCEVQWLEELNQEEDEDMLRRITSVIKTIESRSKT